MEEHILPNNEKVLYDPDQHKYFVKDKEVPSVTTILKTFYGDHYSAVRPEILQAAAAYGTAVHDEIDKLNQKRKEDPNCLIDSKYLEVRNFFDFVVDIYHVDPIIGEQIIVVYDTNGEPFTCGRFDMLCNINGNLTLADIKTTSSINRQSVSGQLNLYACGAYQCGYITKEQYDNLKLAAIHLSGNTSKVVPITKFADNFYLNFLI